MIGRRGHIRGSEEVIIVPLGGDLSRATSSDPSQADTVSKAEPGGPLPGS